MVEFAIVAGVFVLLMIGIIEFGIIFWEQSAVRGAAREGARFAMVRGTVSGRTTDSAAVATYVIGKSPLSPLTVRPTWPTSKAPGEVVQVKVEYTHRRAVGIMRIFLPDTMVLAGTSRSVIVF